MGQKSPYKPIALVVEDDLWQRELMVALLEESEMSVIQCEIAEGALRMLETMDGCVTIMFTAINLAGEIDGVELAHSATRRYPNIRVVVTSALAPTKACPKAQCLCRSHGFQSTCYERPSVRSIDHGR
jgi:DNA-binding NtrC family response regulator